MSEPTYLCLTPMGRELFPVEINQCTSGDSCISALSRLHNLSAIPCCPSLKPNGIDEVTENLELSSHGRCPPWKSTIFLESSLRNQNDDDSATALLRCAIHRLPESDYSLLLSRLAFPNSEVSSSSYTSDSWSLCGSDFELLDDPNDLDDDWLFLFPDDHRPDTLASSVDSLFNNYDGGSESIPSSLLSSHLTWDPSPETLIEHVGAHFLELTPNNHLSYLSPISA